MSGVTNLETLLKSMNPKLLDGQFVFITVKNAKYGDYTNLHPIATFMEEEGMTLIVPREIADEEGHPYESIFRCITLQVHSSLDAVGLTAVFSNKLAGAGISANVFAGYYHDHIFVQSELALEADEILRKIGK